MHQPLPAPAKHRHLVVLVLKNDGGEYCLQFRDGNQGIFNPLRWSLFGGHVEPGESAGRTACRELEEEIGVRVDEGQIAFLDRFELPQQTYDVFECKKPINWGDIQLREGAGCGFFTTNEIHRLENVSHLVEWFRTTLPTPATAPAARGS